MKTLYHCNGCGHETTNHRIAEQHRKEKDHGYSAEPLKAVKPKEWGGKRPGSGRKPKTVEQKIDEMLADMTEIINRWEENTKHGHPPTEAERAKAIKILDTLQTL